MHILFTGNSRPIFFRGLVALLGLTRNSHAKADAFAQSCTMTGIGKAIEHLNSAVTVDFVMYEPAGSNVSAPDNPQSCGAFAQVMPVDFCRVAMAVNTSSISQITMETWLPRNWTGRVLGTGNGGLNGCIDYVDVAYGAQNGFATFGTNNGHNGTNGQAFYMNNEVVEDFAYRALHTGAIVGKEITTAFYNKNYTKSYYIGCSTGGREGFKEAQSFPADFDGIIAGAPAIDFNHLNVWSNHFYPLLGPVTSSGFPPVSMWPIIHQEILRQCDALDGALDGIIEDPELCYFRPEALICSAGKTTNCLTGAQAATVRQVYEPIYGLNGTLIYPRMQPGSELISSGVYYSGAPLPYGVDFWQHAVFNDTSITANSATPQFVAAVDALDSTVLWNISTFNPDLSAFRNSGGKLITYHGQQDWLISSSNSPRYYNMVSEAMSLASSELDDFYRFFRISGMGHCSGGPGAWHFGQAGNAVSTMDVEDNVLMRIVAWVEEGKAPETLRGTKYVNDDPSMGVEFRRKHCKYPARNVHVGPGNYTKAGSWQCEEDSF